MLPAERPRILLIDDVPANLRALADLLVAHYDLQFATSSTEALRLLHQRPLPDLILLDVMMPDMDGYATCLEIKHNPDTRHIPVIFITALDEATDEILGLEVGAADYIAKPFNPDIALARIRNQLRQTLALAQLHVAPRPMPGGQNRICFNGAFWEIAFQGNPAFHLRGMQGLMYLQCLLLHPNRAFSVEELVFLMTPRERNKMLANVGAHLDQNRLHFYRTLTQNLHANQASFPMPSRIEQVLKKLQRDGLFNRDMTKLIDDRERYRKSTGNAIRRALREIAIRDPMLTAHLQPPTLRLGYQLVYSPTEEVIWTA